MNVFRTGVVCSPSHGLACVRRVLDEHGISPLHFQGVRQAEEAFARERFHLIVCEAQLGDGTYRDVLRTVQQTGQDALVIVICPGGEIDIRDYVDAIESGALDYLPCACSTSDLWWVLRGALLRLSRQMVEPRVLRQAV